MGFIPSTSSHHHQLKKPSTQPPLHFSSSSSPHLQTSSISFNGTNTSYNPTSRSSLSSTSFMGFLSEHMSKLSSNHHLLNTSTTSSTSSLLQAQENSLRPIQNYQVVKDNIFMFGAGDQPSCSSSDGSCNHISYGKDSNIHEYDHHGSGGGTYNFYDEAMVAEENHKFVLSSNGTGDHHGWSATDHQKQNGFWGNHHQFGQNIHNHYQQSVHGYGSVDVEEVKQVIESTASNNNNFLFSSDENKTQGGDGGGKEVRYYY